MPTRCKEAKSGNKAAKQLGSEAAKRNWHYEKEQTLSIVIASGLAKQSS